LIHQNSVIFSNDPAFVVVSRSFTKTSQLLLNEITSHRLAGIFAKPLSERDAPGYKDLVLRPQDLKNIKAAITRGGKAASIAVDAFEASIAADDADNDQTPTLETSNSSGEKAIGNGVYLLLTSEDLVPPKSIVNSAQLEMELTRMFANAVMFNPLPSSERGFGRNLRLRKRGGDVAPPHRQTIDEDEDQEETSGSDASSPSDTGGIISDTREMYEDVMTLVSKWREVELEKFGGSGTVSNDIDVTPTAAGPSSRPQHHGSTGKISVNMSSNASLRHSESVEKDDVAGPSTPAITGTARKRRRVGEPA
jgi:hypothetical protein